jgi:hypothetical protein
MTDSEIRAHLEALDLEALDLEDLEGWTVAQGRTWAVGIVEAPDQFAGWYGAGNRKKGRPDRLTWHPSLEEAQKVADETIDYLEEMDTKPPCCWPLGSPWGWERYDV